MRPTIRRPSIRGLADGTSGKPLVLEVLGGRSIEVESDAFLSELVRLQVVVVEYPLGNFLVIAERRKRGDRYWVARAYFRGTRAAIYLGRTFDEAGIRRAATELAARLGWSRDDRSSEPRSAVEAVMQDMIRRERDPGRRAAVETIVALVRRREEVRLT